MLGFGAEGLGFRVWVLGLGFRVVGFFLGRFGQGWALEGLAKPVALWSPGPWSRGPWSLVLWSRGPLVSWSSGPAVLWSRGPPSHKPTWPIAIRQQCPPCDTDRSQMDVYAGSLFISKSRLLKSCGVKIVQV